MDIKTKKYPMYYNGSKQTYPDIKPGMICRSKTAIIGNLIFLSGMDSRAFETGRITSEKFEEQLIVCLDKIRLSLEEAGSSMNNLVKYLVLLKSYEDAARLWKPMLQYYQKYAPQLVAEPPAITITQVEALEAPGCLLEIDSIAVMSPDEPGWEMKRYPMYYGGVKQSYPNVEEGKPFLSESVTVGNMLFLSAMDGKDTNTGKIETNVFEEQAHVALDKVRRAMDNAGSSMSNLVKSLHFMTGVDDLLNRSRDVGQSFSPASDRLWKSELEYYDKYAPFLIQEFPSSTFLKVSSLASPDVLTQTEFIGVVSRYRKDWETKYYPCYLARRGFPRHIGDIHKYYANSIAVGNVLIPSGAWTFDPVTGRHDPNLSFADQVWRTFNNLKDVLEEAGSSLEHLVKTWIYVIEPDNRSIVREVELEFYKKYAPSLIDEPPASTTVLNYGLAAIGRVEIDSIALVPNRL